jgi:hypothetical protein
MPEEITLTREQMTAAIAAAANEVLTLKSLDERTMLLCTSFAEIVSRRLFGNRGHEMAYDDLVPPSLVNKDQDPAGVVTVDGDTVTANEAGIKNKYQELFARYPGMANAGRAGMIMLAQHLLGKWKPTRDKQSNIGEKECRTGSQSKTVE